MSKFEEKILQMEKEIKGNTLKINDLDKNKTALVVVDMVKGFVHKGALSSPRVQGIIKEIVELNYKTLGSKKIFFLDEHTSGSTELKSYEKHCLKDTEEAELIDELKEEKEVNSNIAMIPKNSVNGFHAPGFKLWLEENEAEVENYIICGCEVDICVSNFANTLKTYFNQKDSNKRVIVPSNAVETFDFGTHDGDLMKIISLWEMKSNGIEIVDKII
ncbi:cysteine hydrolase family protein [Clostridium felsineum]|uniref:Uncharacterized protein n=1 Tax=Clostridium felsineum TaxID=36839 RepID=A0A1S8LMV9_9CLOT|nr:isochorismatase family cysteine hydrolase [Clostridium felsineum]URZ00760.1 hypothetical protein CLAUR_007480 [Clostridium felsineum]URZ06600.1 hypothetical protein CLROS_019330 [Clostridium felsineum]URZ11635.1 hypothetical protein CROST_023520 [Clostridium felsineum]URZ16196.1 hypothetical protein CLFE_022430 [Clostridium felsineum DSM 794]